MGVGQGGCFERGTKALLSSPFSASLHRGALAGSSLRRQPPPSWDWPISRTASEELLVPAQET